MYWKKGAVGNFKNLGGKVVSSNVCTAKRKLERRQFSTSSSFVEI